jgi:hypothetical protein
MNTFDRYRQCWPDTETRATVPPKRPLWRAVAAVAAVAYCINVAAVAAVVYLLTVVLFSL